MSILTPPNALATSKVQRAVDWLVARMADPLHIRTYGNSLLTGPTKRFIAFGGWMIIILWFYERIAWQMFFNQVLELAPYATLLSVVIASVMVILERNIFAYDTIGTKRTIDLERRTAGAMLGRGVMLLVMAVLTAMPFQLSVYAEDIEQLLKTQEKGALDQIRAAEEQTIRTDFAKKIADVRDRKNDDVSQTETANANRHDKIVAERKADHDRLTKSAESAQSACTTAFTSTDRETHDLYTSYCADAQTKKKARDEFDKETQRQLDALEAGRATTQSDDKAARDQRIVALETERDVALRELGTINPDELANRRGGTWRKPRGLPEQYIAMLTIAKTDWLNSALFIFYFLFTVGIAAVPLLNKLFAPSDLVGYLSARLQAAAQHPDAEKNPTHELVRLQFVFANGGKDAVQTRFDRASAAFLRAYAKFYLEARTAAMQGASNGRIRPFHEVSTDVIRLWKEESALALTELIDARTCLERCGLEEPDWQPKSVPPIETLARWESPDIGMLAELGWYDPVWASHFGAVSSARA